LSASRIATVTIGFGFAALAGCSGPCSDLNSANQNVANKFATCLSGDPNFFASTFVPCFDQNACETNIKSCSSADQDAFEAEVACQNSYASNSDCSAAGWSAENECVLAASTNADGGTALSAACAAAVENNQGSCGGDAGS
jgi:hypothetical protein